jgi:hypothetical protein
MRMEHSGSYLHLRCYTCNMQLEFRQVGTASFQLHEASMIWTK